MRNRTAHLRVKIRYLAVESRIIRHEEHKAKKNRDYTLFFSLNNHRRKDVRQETRHSLLAYGFLHGISYARMEKRCREDNHPDFKRIEELIRRFGIIRITDDYRVPDQFAVQPEPESAFCERLIQLERDWNVWMETAKQHLSTNHSSE